MNEYMSFWDKIFNFFIGIWDSFYQSVIYDNRYEYIFEGLFKTVIIALLAVIKGTIIGVIIAFIRNNYDTNDKMKLANKIAKLYVNIIRGTPVILQLMIIYYVIFKSVDINIIVVAVIALGIKRIKEPSFAKPIIISKNPAIIVATKSPSIPSFATIEATTVANAAVGPAI